MSDPVIVVRTPKCGLEWLTDLCSVTIEDPHFDEGRGGSVLLLGWIDPDKNIAYGTVVRSMDAAGNITERMSEDHSYILTLPDRTWTCGPMAKGTWTGPPTKVDGFAVEVR